MQLSSISQGLPFRLATYKLQELKLSPPYSTLYVSGLSPGSEVELPSMNFCWLVSQLSSLSAMRKMYMTVSTSSLKATEGWVPTALGERSSSLF